MIVSFKDADAYELITKRKHRDYANILKTVLRKLDRLEAVDSLEDLNVPPGNRLEALQGSRAGQHSIRINDQFRICFVWKTDGATTLKSPIITSHRKEYQLVYIHSTARDRLEV